jgi:hypothetical protein
MVILLQASCSKWLQPLLRVLASEDNQSKIWWSIVGLFFTGKHIDLGSPQKKTVGITESAKPKNAKPVGNSSKTPRDPPNKTPRPRLNVARAMYICTSVDPSGNFFCRRAISGNRGCTQPYPRMEIYGNIWKYIDIS